MSFKGFVKRFFPFFLTFSFGLLIASFFVTVSAPNLKFRRGWSNHHRYHYRLESENRRLKEENSFLKKQLADRKDSNLEIILDVPPPPTIKDSYRVR